MASYEQNRAPLGASWAHVRLLRGRSGTIDWSIGAGHPEARLTVGSAMDATWAVEGPGVLPYHFELFWDGHRLWVADVSRAGNIALNGRPVLDWVQIESRSEIVFGSAAMSVEWAHPAEVGPTDDRATVVSIEIGGQGNDLAAEATRIHAPLSESKDLPSAVHTLRATPSERPLPRTWTDSTYVAPEGMTSGVVLPGAPLRPHLGREGAPASAHLPAQTMNEDEMSVHLAAAQQRIAQTSSVAPQPVAPPSVTPPSNPEPMTGFVAPPDLDQSGSRTKSKLPFPVRTMVLSAVAILVTLGLGLWMLLTPATPQAVPTPPQAVPTPPQAVPTPPQAVPTPPQAVPTPPQAVPTPPQAVPTPPQAVPTPPQAVPTPPQAVPTPPAVQQAPIPSAPTPDRRAVDLVIAGRYADAIAAYRSLLEAHPERHEYAVMVRILERRMQRCQGGVSADGRPCTGR